MLGVLDLISIQECLDGYRKTIASLPVEDTVELELKEERLRLINYLIRRCEGAMVRDE